MVNNMKRYKILIPIVISILLGYGFSRLMFQGYNQKMESVFSNQDQAYFVKYAAYHSKDEMLKSVTSLTNYIYILENNNYQVYVGISKNKKNAKKIEDIYQKMGNKVSIERRSVFNLDFISMLIQYDALLKVTNDKSNILLICSKVLKQYQEMEKTNAV